MRKEASVNIRGEELILLPEKAVFWPNKKLLFLADPHFGKAEHFRRAGIPVPLFANRTDIVLLRKLIATYYPSKVLILGDLFHSTFNDDWEKTSGIFRDNPEVEFILTKGNHDILPEHVLTSSGLNLSSSDVLDMAPFCFTHEFREGMKTDNYNFSGHVHPAVKLSGKGKQSLKFPCFYFTDDHAILPAFGRFTGTHVINPLTGDRVFIIAEKQVEEVILF